MRCFHSPSSVPGHSASTFGSGSKTIRFLFLYSRNVISRSSPHISLNPFISFNTLVLTAPRLPVMMGRQRMMDNALLTKPVPMWVVTVRNLCIAVAGARGASLPHTAYMEGSPNHLTIFFTVSGRNMLSASVNMTTSPFTISIPEFKALALPALGFFTYLIFIIGRYKDCYHALKRRHNP